MVEMSSTCQSATGGDHELAVDSGIPAAVTSLARASSQLIGLAMVLDFMEHGHGRGQLDLGSPPDRHERIRLSGRSRAGGTPSSTGEFTSGRMRYRLFVSVVLLATLLFPTSSAVAVAQPSTAAVAAQIARQLGCLAFAYDPGSSSASGSQGQLDCHRRRQDFIVYVFDSNRFRSMGVAHLLLWSGPDDVYYFARNKRAIIVPQGNCPKPGYTNKWATFAATRTGGAVFSG